MSTESAASPAKKYLFISGLIALFIFCLFIFTVSKLPESKMTALIQGYVQAALDPYGVYITDQGREFSIWRGFRYKLIHPTIELSDQTRVELDEITVAPKLLSLFMLKPGAEVELKQGVSSIFLEGSGRGDKISAHGKLDQVNVGKLGVLTYLAQLKGGGIVTGDFNLDGSLSEPTSLTGQAQLNLKSIQIDEQNLMGFQLDTMKVADGVVDVQIAQSKVQFKNVRIGKPNTADDLNLQVTGDIALNRNLNSSVLNLRATLGLSERVKTKLSLVDTIMGSAKTPDGRYAYKLTGTLNSPFPNPDPNSKP